MLDLKRGFFVAMWLILRQRLNCIHARSYVPGVLAFVLAKVFRIAWIFDTRGLWADEKVDSGDWSRTGLVYKVFKKLERQMLKQADAIVVLTHASKEYLRDYTDVPIWVISTCTNLKLFVPSLDRRKAKGILVYVGSLGGWYMSQEMVLFYAAWRKYAPDPRFLLVTKSDVSDIRRALSQIGAESELIHKVAQRDEVSELIQNAQAALCFVRPTFSKIGSMPTKLGEYLACGVPVAANIVGDMAQVFHASPAGVVLPDFSEGSIALAAKELFRRSLDSEVRAAARTLAERWFNLEKAVQVYDEIYRSLGVA